jgi:hypothetical protein
VSPLCKTSTHGSPNGQRSFRCRSDGDDQDGNPEGTGRGNDSPALFISTLPVLQTYLPKQDILIK